MTIELIHELDVTPEDHIALTDHVGAAFAENSVSPGDRSFFFEPPHMRIISRIENEIAGHLAIFLRTVRIGDLNANTAAIGDVSVAIPYRRRGIASELVKTALKVAKKTGLDFVWLAGDEKIYSEAGFCEVQNQVTRVSWETGQLISDTNHKLMVHDLDAWDWADDDPVNLLGLML